MQRSPGGALQRQRAAVRTPIVRLALATIAALVCAAAPRLTQAQINFGVVTPNLKVRPNDRPPLANFVSLKAGRNEFEAFQIVLHSGQRWDGISVRLSQPLRHPSGATIPVANVVLYRAAYYELSVPSNLEGAPGRWPDPLIPVVDTYVGERRNAFPFELPADESRVVWVDILVPIDAAAGIYEGELAVERNGNSLGTIPVQLVVGDFTLPSTSSLRSAFGVSYHNICRAHTGTSTCSPTYNYLTGIEMRERYVRAALEHRFTLDEPFFEPPHVVNPEPAARLILPLINGTSNIVRLPGAKLTTIRVRETTGEGLRGFLDYATANGFYDQLFFYPVDEPHERPAWVAYSERRDLFRQTVTDVPTILTTAIQDSDEFGVTEQIDIFVPTINQLEERLNLDTPYDGYQRPKYDDWLRADPARELWAYQGCISHGCGACGAPTNSPIYTGWPARVIDGPAVQTRAMPWLLFSFDVSGELYFAVDEQLQTAWEPDGQCKFSGSGDGTLFYPGTPARIGGQTGIPIESIRMKLIREGMEDYEYLKLAAREDSDAAYRIARTLFPHAYECDQPAAKLEAARAELFEILADGVPDPPPPVVPTRPDAGVAPDLGVAVRPDAGTSQPGPNPGPTPTPNPGPRPGPNQNPRPSPTAPKPDAGVADAATPAPNPASPQADPGNGSAGLRQSPAAALSSGGTIRGGCTLARPADPATPPTALLLMLGIALASARRRKE